MKMIKIIVRTYRIHVSMFSFGDNLSFNCGFVRVSYTDDFCRRT